MLHRVIVVILFSIGYMLGDHCAGLSADRCRAGQRSVAHLYIVDSYDTVDIALYYVAMPRITL